jgi:N-sulfoglucosamine sulfohydrolase
VATVARDGGFSILMNKVFGGSEPHGAIKWLLDMAAQSGIDWDQVLRMGNAWYDRMAAAYRKPTRTERQAALGKIDSDIRKLIESARDWKALALGALGNPREVLSQRMGEIMIALLLPAFSTAANAEDRGAMLFELTNVAMALAEYRADQGLFPVKLADLAPKYLARVPQDIFSAADLHYQRQGDGYLLYSVGPNGRDDGGKGYEDCKAGEGWDDLAVRMTQQAAERRSADVARPNILWLIAEDLGPHLGCCGAKEVRTPNLDRLAGEGVRYARFYTGNVCSPSRSSFMTGMYATTIGAHHHRSHRSDGYTLPQGVRVLTDWMRDAGYFTANVRDLPPSCGFKGTAKTDWNFTYDGKPFDSASWDDLKAHQPFYAQVNFNETHRAYHAPPQADLVKVEIPPYYPDHPVTRADWAKYLDSVSELDRKVGLVLSALEHDGLAGNTVVVFFGDNGQSHVRGKQFCYEEGLLVPLIIRWPGKFPAPPQIKPGTVDTRLLHAIDLAPTMLALAGAPKPAKMQGQVFLGDRCEPARQYVFGARDRCDETAMRIRTVRDQRYRYLRNFTPETPLLAPNAYKERQYPVWNLLKELHAQGKLTPAQEFLCRPRMPDEELYDLQADPHEIRNLANSRDPQHQAELQKLRAVLEQWIVESDDQGRLAEPAASKIEKPAAKPASEPKAKNRPGKAGKARKEKP